MRIWAVLGILMMMGFQSLSWANEAPEASAPAETEAESAPGLPESELYAKVIAQGVPAEAFKDVQEFLRTNLGKEFVQDTYSCKGKDETSVRPCGESDRIKTTKVVTLKAHSYAVIADYTKASTEERFYVINM